MNRRSKVWSVLAAVYTVINVGGAGYAVARGEWPHAAVHVGLLLAGYVVWRLVFRPQPLDLPREQQTEDRLELLQQSVDAIALEVERISEAQRFRAKLEAERVENPPPRQKPS